MKRTGLRNRYRLAVEMEPVQEQCLPLPWRLLRRAESMAVLVVLDVNGRLIDRFGGAATTGLWPRDTFPWTAAIEAQTDGLRDEYLRYADEWVLAHVAEFAGLDPESPRARQSVPVSGGAWRNVPLVANGNWIPSIAARLPLTQRAFAPVRGMVNLGYSVLDPHSHIGAHRDPDRGALRIQLPIIVPGAPGQCRIRVGDTTVGWTEGEAVVFDLTTQHEVWNDADEPRVLLMAEVRMPLPWWLDACNRLTLVVYRAHPSHRNVPERMAELSERRRAPSGA
jgi:aspartyl/asparaginyl beta-hydroxylase (cupin superfamily)